MNTVNKTATSVEGESGLSPILLAMNVIVHFTLIGITIFIVYHSFANGITLFSWHPSLLSIGFVVFMAEAILAFSELNIATNLGHKKKVALHWILQSIAGICIFLGFLAIYINKNLLGKEHFTTYHGIFGLATVILTSIAAVGGVFAKYSLDLRTYVRPVYLKIGHAALGSVTFLFSIVTIILAFYTHWFSKFSSAGAQTACSVTLVAIAIYIIIKPTQVIISRIAGAIRTSI